MIFRFTFPLATLVLSAILAGPMTGGAAADEQPADREADSSSETIVREVIADACLDCHSGNEAKGNLDLSRLSWRLEDAANRRTWILAHDRVSKGEMPPDAASLDKGGQEKLLKNLSEQLHDADWFDVRENGRGPMRRLTRCEYEQNLRDLLNYRTWTFEASCRPIGRNIDRAKWPMCSTFRASSWTPGSPRPTPR